MLRNSILILLSFFGVVNFSFAQTQAVEEWIKIHSGRYARPTFLKLDTQGNVYFTGTKNFGGIMVKYSNQGEDIYSLNTYDEGVLTFDDSNNVYVLFNGS